jgi:hypothetical protein
MKPPLSAAQAFAYAQRMGWFNSNPTTENNTHQRGPKSGPKVRICRACFIRPAIKKYCSQWTCQQCIDFSKRAKKV